MLAKIINPESHYNGQVGTVTRIPHGQYLTWSVIVKTFKGTYSSMPFSDDELQFLSDETHCEG